VAYVGAYAAGSCTGANESNIPEDIPVDISFYDGGCFCYSIKLGPFILLLSF
jgi:hypothetical protein